VTNGGDGEVALAGLGGSILTLTHTTLASLTHGDFHVFD